MSVIKDSKRTLIEQDIEITESASKRLCSDSSAKSIEPFVRASEKDVGITEYVSDLLGFNAVIKERYSDFIVNEIDLEGNVVELTDLKPPVNPEREFDVDKLLDEETLSKIEKLNQNEVKEVKIEVTDKDKDTRKEIHVALRQKFEDIESTTEGIGDQKFIVVKKTNKNRKGRRFQPSIGGNYLHFVLYKENKDTMDTINNIASFFKLQPKFFSYAGTKDKRAKTSQMVSVYRMSPEKLLSINDRFNMIKVGNISYKKEQLKLGDLLGNRFILVLRQLDGESSDVEKAMKSLENEGFINYYGLQRFGTSSVPTHLIGKNLLQGEWSKAIDLILTPKGEDDEELASAKKIWFESRDAEQALKRIRRKWGIEGRLLDGLAHANKNDLFNALGAIPRNIRMMYVHSYQSYIWNKVTSKRFQVHGFKVLKGDLVARDKSVLVNTLESDSCESNRKAVLENLVKVLGEEEVEKYSITDVLLPLPGHSVVLPDNETKDWYDEMLKEDGMNWNHFNSKQKSFSLSGDYRKIIVVPENVKWEIVSYSDVTKPLVLSDIEKMSGTQLPESSEDGHLRALKLELQLPPSAYATMAVREILKRSTYYSNSCNSVNSK